MYRRAGGHLLLLRMNILVEQLHRHVLGYQKKSEQPLFMVYSLVQEYSKQNEGNKLKHKKYSFCDNQTVTDGNQLQFQEQLSVAANRLIIDQNRYFTLFQ